MLIAEVMIDFDRRQHVDGFSELVSQGDLKPYPTAASIGAGTTGAWWLADPTAQEDLVWSTAPVSEAVDSTFTFVGESTNQPEGRFPPMQATLYADDEPVVRFDLGCRAPKEWVDGDWALDFTPQLVSATVDGHHRQFQPRGCSGVYRLAAPAGALTAGKPLRIKVIVGYAGTDVAAWFAVHDGSGAGQIEALQREVIQLKRTIGNLARRNYRDLFPDYLDTEDAVIYTNGRAHVHDADVAQLDNGDLIVCLREGSEHISNDGRTVTVRSSDGGRTWGDRQVVRAHPHTDEREASISQLRDGTVLMNAWVNPFYDAQGVYRTGPSDTDRGRRGGIYVGRSSDRGRTWSWPDDHIDPSPYQHIFTSERITELPSGRLLMATYFRAAPTPYLGSALFCSDDAGVRWRYLATLADLPGHQLGEPALLYTSKGLLISIIRNDTRGESTYYQAVSEDEGDTWTSPEPTPIPGARNPASLVELPDGLVLCIHGSRDDPIGFYVMPSHDGGRTWEMAERRVIRDDLPNWDIGYPSSVLLPDGRVFVAYYFNLFERYVIAGSAFRWP